MQDMQCAGCSRLLPFCFCFYFLNLRLVCLFIASYTTVERNLLQGHWCPVVERQLLFDVDGDLLLSRWLAGPAVRTTGLASCLPCWFRIRAARNSSRLRLCHLWTGKLWNQWIHYRPQPWLLQRLPLQNTTPLHHQWFPLHHQRSSLPQVILSTTSDFLSTTSDPLILSTTSDPLHHQWFPLHHQWSSPPPVISSPTLGSTDNLTKPHYKTSLSDGLQHIPIL